MLLSYATRRQVAQSLVKSLFVVADQPAPGVFAHVVE
jgi:hypothetical protein